MTNKSARIIDIEIPFEKLNPLIDLLKDQIIKKDHIEAKIVLIGVKNLAPKFSLETLLGKQLYLQSITI